MSAEIDRFWSKVNKSGNCWQWTGYINPKGYGYFKKMRAHRYAHALTSGPIPEGMQVDHICRNRSCVNPDHLRLATPAQNSEHQNGNSDSKSGRRGVSYHTQSGKWLVKVTKAGKTYTAGLHTDIEVAAEAARQLRLELFTRNELDKQVAA